MKTIYAACLSRLGLSQAEAADLHGAGIQTVKHWSSGRRPVPAGVWDDLRAYNARIMDRADAMLETWEAAGSPPIEIDDSESDGVGLMAYADLVLSTDAPVHIGQTAATMMARQARRPN